MLFRRMELSEAVGVQLVREELVNHYVQLLKDNEAEVRTAAAGQIPGIVNQGQEPRG
jgi:serine/threonine-protein phosphatase 2A regulatory subunit A